jgi:hypothetical protein
MSSSLVYSTKSGDPSCDTRDLQDIKSLIRAELNDLQFAGWSEDDERVQKLRAIVALFGEEKINDAFVKIVDYVHDHGSYNVNDAVDIIEQMDMPEDR